MGLDEGWEMENASISGKTCGSLNPQPFEFVLVRTLMLPWLVWHHSVNGDYSVKFGYGVAMDLMENDVLGVDFLESWGKFHECVKGRDNADEIYQEFAFGLWRLWKNRNEVVFNGLHRQPLEVVDLWRKNINEFRAASASVEVDDWAKEVGVLQAAGGSGTVLCHSAAVAEAIAIRTALVACINHIFNHVSVVSDAKLIIQMIRKEVSADFSLDCVLGDIKILAQKLTSVTFAFVPRESNHAAHLVAKYVFKEGRDFIWDCVGPAFLFNALAKDVNLMICL
ncbi:unnamed protein product [Malus baccata var. baccata]